MTLSLAFLQVLLDPARKKLLIIIIKSILTWLKCLASPNLRSTVLVFKCRAYLLSTPLTLPLTLPFVSLNTEDVLSIALADFVANSHLLHIPAYLKAHIRFPVGKQS